MARILKQYSTLGMVIIPFGKIDEATQEQVRKEFDLRAVFDMDHMAPKTVGALARREIDPYYAFTGRLKLSEESAACLGRIVREYDLVWFHGILLPNSLGRATWPNAVLDIDDIQSQVYEGIAKQQGNWFKRLKAVRQVILWRRRERVLLDRFGIVCVCSDRDKQYLGGGDGIHIIPNGFEAPSSEPVRIPVDPPQIGFIGTLCYQPNFEGLRWFISHVWPLVKAARRDARLRLVGMNTDAGIAATGPDIDGLGFVDDVSREIAGWSASIVPINVGGGTRIKIAEAFSRKSPVVSTSLGAYGYKIESGRECLLADSARDFAAACVGLLESRELGDGLAERAWERFSSEWSWDAIAPKVLAAVDSCLSRVGVADRPWSRQSH